MWRLSVVANASQLRSNVPSCKLVPAGPSFGLVGQSWVTCVRRRTCIIISGCGTWSGADVVGIWSSLWIGAVTASTGSNRLLARLLRGTKSRARSSCNVLCGTEPNNCHRQVQVLGEGGLPCRLASHRLDHLTVVKFTRADVVCCR